MTTPWWAFFILGGIAWLMADSDLKAGKPHWAIPFALVSVCFDVLGLVAIFKGGAL